jgi:hypothetical protein
VYLLRVPVRYYHRPPTWFHGWVGSGAPHWHEHWGASWAERRGDWVHWDGRGRMPGRAPLPVYQRSYAGAHYPRAEDQARFHSQNYHYAPRDKVVQQHYAEHGYEHAQQREERHDDRRGNHDNRGHEEHHDRR